MCVRGCVCVCVDVCVCNGVPDRLRTQLQGSSLLASSVCVCVCLCVGGWMCVCVDVCVVKSSNRVTDIFRAS